MGRGLSDLQKTILRLALAKSQMPRHARHLIPQPAEVTREEIFVNYFGWETQMTRYDDMSSWPHGAERPRCYTTPAEVGQAAYDAAQTSVSRALRRLQARGLINHAHNPILTKDGWVQAVSDQFVALGTPTKPFDRQSLSDEFENNCCQTKPLSAEEIASRRAELRAAWGPRRELSPREQERLKRRHEETNRTQREYARRRRARMRAREAKSG